MALRGRKAVERYCTGWSDFSSVQIWTKYRESGFERFGRELGSACNHLLWYLRKLVPWAIARGYLPESGATELSKIRKLPTNSRRIRVPSLYAVNEFLQMVSSEDPQGGDFLRFLAATGLRLRAATGLTWADIDISAGQMHVRQKGGRIKTLPLTPEALQMLKKRKDEQHFKPFGLDQKTIEILERRMKRFAKGLDLDLTYFHAFRHYFASRALMAGLTVQEVSALLGHSDGGVLVLKTYAHICSDHLKNAVAHLKLAS
jgi:integrase